MRNQAVWRSRVDDPRTFFGWLARDLGSPFRVVFERLAWILRAGAAAALLSGHWLLAPLLFALSSIPGEASSIRDAIPLPWRTLPIDPLLTLPPVDTPFPLHIEVRKSGTVLGYDAGVVTFVEGWLLYEGLRTRFSLRRLDVSRRSENTLDLAGGGEVAFFPHDRLAVEGHFETGLAKRFRGNLMSWMRSDSPLGESLLPPPTVHPTGIVRAESDLAAVTLTGTVLVAWAAPHLTSVVNGVIGLSFAIGIARAVRDLRRLRRLTRLSTQRAAVE